MPTHLRLESLDSTTAPLDPVSDSTHMYQPDTHVTLKKSLLRFFWVSLKPDGRKWSQYWQLNNLKCLLIQKNEYISYVNEKECADATVKNLPFFARFPWQYDGIEAWEQEHLLWWIKPKNSVFLNHLSVPKVGEILGGCDAFCANSTVKILPFFARFPWFFLEIDSCVQGQLSGCSLFKWICPWYRKVVTNVIKINISHLGNILAGFQGKKGTQSQPSTTSVRLFTGQVWRMR